ncbi:MAG: hypothetical protein ABI894_02025 [Ilumatobacteraceae bacterium]
MAAKWGTKAATKAKGIVASLKAQHAAGLQGDEAPAEPVWPTPKQQLEAFKRLFSSSNNTDRPDADASQQNDVDAGPADADPADGSECLDRDAHVVAEALRGVDWVQVRAATAERTNDVARTMRSMAEHVDWAKVQPVAAQVSSALIAAVAAGRIPVGGPLGSIVARAITDQNNLGKRIAVNLQRTPAHAPPDFRGAIEATATES